MAWIDGRYPHAHYPDELNPWELLWLRFDSHDLPQLCSLLFIHKVPVFHKLNPGKIKFVFKRILGLMKQRPPHMEALLHAEMANLLAQLYRARLHRESEEAKFARNLSPQFNRTFAQMKQDFQKPWRVADLARMACMSEPHFFRCFKRSTGSSPVDWLRRERINQAKRYLIETDDSVSEIANRVGYADAAYFSRDFKHMAGHSPAQYRREERGR